MTRMRQDAAGGTLGRNLNIFTKFLPNKYCKIRNFVVEYSQG